ncbi:hypothetical protein G4G27_17270 [Sphingomonas sp. So64.6b]|nr:hypothetical protein G4G27_17270 [Sphingomonas sp. So64.6b]
MPTVVAVQGAAAGAGLSLVAFVDMAVAARSASFVMAYARIGLTADGGATWLLPRVIGFRRTQEMALIGRRLNPRGGRALQASDAGRRGCRAGGRCACDRRQDRSRADHGLRRNQALVGCTGRRLLC